MILMKMSLMMMNFMMKINKIRRAKNMEKNLIEFLEELKYNQQINLEKGIENRIDINYVIERITEILKFK